MHDQTEVWLAPTFSQIHLIRKFACTSFVARISQPAVSSQMNYLNLSFGYLLGSGCDSCKNSICSILFVAPLGSLASFDTTRNIYCQFQLVSQNMLDSQQLHVLYSPWNSPGQNTGAFPFSRGSSQSPGIEPRSPTLQEDSLPSEPPGKPKILDWVAYSFCRGTS